jgi:hypothetical protein
MNRAIRVLGTTFVVLVLAIAGCKSVAPDGPTTQCTVASYSYSDAIARGVQYLVKSQQPEGCWGTGTETRGLEIYSMVPGSHDAYRVATTALAVMALREYNQVNPSEEVKTAHEKGVNYLIAHGEARRDSGDLLYNVWAHTYSLQALAIEMRTNKDPRIEAMAKWHLDRMIRYATYVGGWNYYDFGAQTQQPSMGPTSFGTAAGLLALWEARQSGLEVPQSLVDSSLRRLMDARAPNGVFLYGSDYKYVPRMPGNQIKGAIGRTQPSNFALWLWSFPGIAQDQARHGLDLFFSEHMYLDMGRKRPWPHEAWYQTSGYYYYFDHYYAALLIDRLPAGDQQKYFPMLASHVAPHQEPDDGSWWDYAMWDYHKPYGTAFAVMTLLRCDRVNQKVTG